MSRVRIGDVSRWRARTLTTHGFTRMNSINVFNERAAQNSNSEIASLGPWFHNLHLPDGTQTAPDHELGDFPSFKWRNIAAAVPQDLSGWRVLDIGCNAG